MEWKLKDGQKILHAIRTTSKEAPGWAEKTLGWTLDMSNWTEEALGLDSRWPQAGQEKGSRKVTFILR